MHWCTSIGEPGRCYPTGTVRPALIRLMTTVVSNRSTVLRVEKPVGERLVVLHAARRHQQHDIGAAGHVVALHDLWSLCGSLGERLPGAFFIRTI